jgi:hypothetical protein
VGEIHRRQGADVGHGKILAGDERPVGQFAVQPALSVRVGLAVGLAELLVLVQQAGGARVGVAPEVADRAHQLELDASHPHVDIGLFRRRPAEQRRLGMDFLEIAADGDGLGNGRAVVQ